MVFVLFIVWGSIGDVCRIFNFDTNEVDYVLGRSFRIRTNVLKKANFVHDFVSCAEMRSCRKREFVR